MKSRGKKKSLEDVDWSLSTRCRLGREEESSGEVDGLGAEELRCFAPDCRRRGRRLSRKEGVENAEVERREEQCLPSPRKRRTGSDRLREGKKGQEKGEEEEEEREQEGAMLEGRGARGERAEGEGLHESEGEHDSEKKKEDTEGGGGEV